MRWRRAGSNASHPGPEDISTAGVPNAPMQRARQPPADCCPGSTTASLRLTLSIWPRNLNHWATTLAANATTAPPVDIGEKRFDLLETIGIHLLSRQKH